MDDLGPLNASQAEALLRFLQAGPLVRRRYQFFVWTQNHLDQLLPHNALVCGLYQRQRRELVFEPFYSVVLAPDLVEALSHAGAELLRQAGAAWVEGRGRPLALPLDRFGAAAGAEAQAVQRACAADGLIVHGVARPQRPAEVESLFVLACDLKRDVERRLALMDLVLPYLHMTWLRVHGLERPPAALPASAATPRSLPLQRAPITERERQILSWVREGKSNLQIGELLGISPLTVKNHVQKVLRKLGAANRAQAVAQAMVLNLLDGRNPPH